MNLLRYSIWALTICAMTGAALAGETDCRNLVGKPSNDVEISRASFVNAGEEIVPARPDFYRPLETDRAFCRVEGTIEKTIGFELWLPDGWNGRLLGAGVGGDAGVFNYTDMSLRIGQGFATVTTDSGHKATDGNWMLNAKAREDYEHRAVHLTATAAKKLVHRYYNKPVDYAYYTGCSGGGRQALKEMQNYPGDYDGVIAGAPGPYMPLQSVRMLWFSLEQQRQPERALLESDWVLYEQRVVEKCDGDDGIKDGIIENPASCKFEISTLACESQTEVTVECIPAARLDMLAEIVSPMTDENGDVMDGGLFPGVRTRPGPPSPLLRAMWADGVHQDPTWDEMTFRRKADLAAANRSMPELRADRTSIAPFISRGNKAILYQGWQDPSTNAGPTIDYYRALAREQGGADKLLESVRLFMVPGMYHCGGGPGVDKFGGSTHRPVALGADPSRDILWALIHWVEDGVAPSQLVGAKVQPDGTGFTRKLCPFPQIAVHDGRGPEKNASSYFCETDPTLAKLFDHSDPAARP